MYHGILQQIPAVTKGILPNIDMPTPHHTILFTDERNAKMFSGEPGETYQCPAVLMK